MPLRATTIRFDDRGAQLIQEAAREAGVSFSQFVREAALMRAVMRTMSTEPALTGVDLTHLMNLVSERVVELSRVDRFDNSES